MADCLHPLSRRVQVWQCADCGESMPGTVRDVLGDPMKPFVHTYGKVAYVSVTPEVAKAAIDYAEEHRCRKP